MTTIAPPAQAPRFEPLKLLAGIRLVAMREMLVMLRSKAFIISFIIGVLFTVGGVLAGSFILPMLAGSQPRVAVTAETQQIAQGAQLEIVLSGTPEQAAQALREGTADIAVLPASAFGHLELYAQEGGQPQLAPDAEFFLLGDKEGSSQVSEALSVTPDTFVLQQPERAPWVRIVLPGLFGVLYFLTVFSYAAAVAVSVVEEKSTRIVEILLATLSPRTIMAGKILGVGALALLQAAGLLVPLIITGFALGVTELVASVAVALLWYIPFLIVGFLLMACLYAGAGATVSRQEEVGSATMPLMFLTMIPYILSFMAGSNETLMTVMSYVPFSAPIAMPTRVALGVAQWWEPLLSLVLLAFTAVASVWLGARVYENSILRTGTRVRLIEALRR